MKQEQVAPALAVYQALKERVQSEFENVDEETLADTLEGISELPDLLACVVRSALDDEALLCALKARIADLRVRADRIERRRSAKRELVRHAMREADLPRLRQGDFTATLRESPPRVTVENPSAIPETFRRPQPDKLDLAGLGLALRSGAVVPGAMLSAQEPSLTVRVR